MGRALLEVSPQFLIELLKATSPQVVDVANFGLPEDARCVDVRYIKSSHVIGIEVESEAYPQAVHPVRLPVLPTPEFRAVAVPDDVDEQRSGDETV